MALTVVYECPDGRPFPVEWPDEEMAGYSWRWDQVKNPLPLTPLSQDFLNAKRDGMGSAGREVGRPSDSERVFVNGYAFARSIPVAESERAQFAAIAERDEAERIDRLLELWESTYMPESEALVAALRGWASPEESLADLAGRWSEVEAISRRLGELHTISTGLMNTGLRQFEEFCAAESCGEGGRIASEAISGMPNKSIESAEALWDLSRGALERAAVAALVRSSAPEEVAGLLAGVDRGDEFGELLDEFLDTYGHRNESYFELSYPTWKEDPRFVMTVIRGFLDLTSEQSPGAKHAQVTARREAATEEALSRLGDGDRGKQFIRLQRRAQQFTILMEDHNFYIDQRGYSTLRAPSLAVGGRMASEGLLEQEDDVFYLHGSEIREAAGHARDLEALIAARRANRDKWTGVLPPAVIGGEPEVGGGSGDACVVRGIGASDGIVRGVARVILTLDEVDRLAPGDVLVTYATAPPWTPVFAYAAAVVTDAGGALSHCAVVAREFGMPAVVGASGATSRIRDGALVEVDGREGVVRLLG